jgi:hypothetical protein
MCIWSPVWLATGWLMEIPVGYQNLGGGQHGIVILIITKFLTLTN